jgi:hypothetical protein
MYNRIEFLRVKYRMCYWESLAVTHAVHRLLLCCGLVTMLGE